MNPIERILRVAENDAAIKVVFDHVRNMVLSALLLTLGTHMLLRPEHYGHPAMLMVMGAVVQVSGGVLALLNVLHGIQKARAIRNRILCSVVWGAIVVVNMAIIPLVYTIRPLSGS